MFLHYLGKSEVRNQQNIAFLPNVVLLLNVNNAQKHILFTFVTLWLTLNPIVSFLAACNKIDRNVGQLCNHKHRDDFSIHRQQYR